MSQHVPKGTVCQEHCSGNMPCVKSPWAEEKRRKLEFTMLISMEF